MNQTVINFTANNQRLALSGEPLRLASKTVNYVKAHFELGENWGGFDSVRAVWSTDFNKGVPAVLDSLGDCVVPHEVLSRAGIVRVNLVGSISEDDVLTDRLTTCLVSAIEVCCNVPVDGTNPQTITPSQFEQFVEAVRDDADRAETASTEARESATEASESATSASRSASASAESATASEQAKDLAQGYAQNAQISAQTAENAKDDAEDARDEILGMRATATTLEEGSEATASYSNGVLTLGIPRGDTGATGAKGDKGDTGATPNLTIGTVETLAPTEDATASITGTAEEPVLNLGLPKGDTGDVSLEDLEALLPTDTASGDIASITDGQSVVPVKSLKVTLEPIQDLHGYDKPWSGGAGRNLLNVGGRVNQTSAKVRYTSDDNYIILNGTKNGASYATMGNLTLTLPAGTYYAKAFGISGTISIDDISLYVNNGTSDITGSIKNAEKSFTLESETILQFRLAVWRDRTVFTNYTVGIVISKTSGIDKFYPYSNICPISGHTECVTEVWEKNLWHTDFTNSGGGLTKRDGEMEVNVSSATSTTYLLGGSSEPIGYKLKSGTYTLSAHSTDFSGLYVTLSDGSTWANGETKTFSADITINNVRCAKKELGTGTYTLHWQLQIELGTTATDYEPYNGNTYTTTLGRTVYGGTLDVVTGELTVDRAMVDMGTLSWSLYDGIFYANVNGKAYLNTNADMICDSYPVYATNAVNVNDAKTKLSDGEMCGFRRSSGQGTASYVYIKDANYSTTAELATALNGKMLCYELATPQTYQLDPQTIDLLLGDNNVWSDSGDVEVVYKADVTKWVEKKLNS